MNTKDIEEIVEEIRDKVRSIGIDTDECGDVYIAGEDIEDICNTLRTTLTTLTQHHEAEVERVVDAERERIEKIEPPVKLMQDGVSNDWSYREGFQDAIKQVLKQVLKSL